MKLSEIKIFEAAKQFSASDFPLVVNNIHPQYVKHFEKGIGLLNDALKAGELTATEAKDIKRYINDPLHSAHNEAIRAKYYHSGKWESLPKDINHLGDLGPEIHRAAGSMKKIEKIKDYDHPLVKDSLAFFNQIKPLTDAAKPLKEMIVKKKKAIVDKEKAIEKETKSTMSHKDVQKVQDVLVKLTQKLHDQLRDNNLDWLISVVEQYKNQYDPDNHRETSYMRKYGRDPFMREVLGKVIRHGKTMNSPESIKSNYKDILHTQAEKMTKETLDRFINKNTDKLGSIIKNKNSLTKIELIRATAGRGVIEGLMKLAFGDKSSFEVNNKIVSSYSKHGKPFYRFPTTFHKVIMPDGSKMSQPSESKMIEQFK